MALQITHSAAASRDPLLTPAALRRQNQIFRGSGGVSEENRSQGFAPAFLDMETGSIQLSRFADGGPAPMHLLDGLPDDLVVSRQPSGRVGAVKPTVVAGFVRDGEFYTREMAARTAMPARDSSGLLSEARNQHLLMSAWERFLADQKAPDQLVRPVVLDSWKRCDLNRVDPHLTKAPLDADRQRLEQSRRRHAALREAAQPILQRAGELLSQADNIVLLTDPGGLILDSAGDPRACDKAHAINLVVGGRWDEVLVGTNAIGTALATRQPVHLYGCEHFCAGIKRWTCSAEVIRDPCDGAPLGVLDISSLTDTFHSQSLDFVLAAARGIEAQLAESHFKSRAWVLEASMGMFQRWRNQGVLALDGRGRLVKVNALAHAALQRLEAKLPLTPQSRIAALDLDLPEPERLSMLPGWLHPEWLQPILHGRARIGTVIVIPSTAA